MVTGPAVGLSDRFCILLAHCFHPPMSQECPFQLVLGLIDREPLLSRFQHTTWEMRLLLSCSSGSCKLKNQIHRTLFIHKFLSFWCVSTWLAPTRAYRCSWISLEPFGPWKTAATTTLPVLKVASSLKICRPQVSPCKLWAPSHPQGLVPHCNDGWLSGPDRT